MVKIEGRDRLGTVAPILMDHSVREPATNTRYGHTAWVKYYLFKLAKLLGFRNLAISGPAHAYCCLMHI